MYVTCSTYIITTCCTNSEICAAGGGIHTYYMYMYMYMYLYNSLCVFHDVNCWIQRCLINKQRYHFHFMLHKHLYHVVYHTTQTCCTILHKHLYHVIVSYYTNICTMLLYHNTQRFVPWYCIIIDKDLYHVIVS